MENDFQWSKKKWKHETDLGIPIQGISIFQKMRSWICGTLPNVFPPFKDTMILHIAWIAGKEKQKGFFF